MTCDSYRNKRITQSLINRVKLIHNIKVFYVKNYYLLISCLIILTTKY